MLPHQAPLIGSLAPFFDLECAEAMPGGLPPRLGRVTVSDFRGRWLVLVFYPHDFSMVCPTELVGLSRRVDDFRRQGCALLGVSVDPVASHLSWLQTPLELGGVAGLSFPLASDPEGHTAGAYGVYLELQRVALRGLFVIDPNGVLQYQTIHNLSVGRRTDDILRIVGAIQSGGLCGEKWQTPTDTIEPARLLVAGYRLGQFEIERPLGTGSSATVFLAHDRSLVRDVALKVFRPGSNRSHSGALAEARSVAALNHPNVCTVFGVDESLGYPIIAMEFAPGSPLDVLQDGKPLPPQRAAAIGRQVANGMAAAHARGVVHGDLKPGNVMVGEGDSVKILDFGLARRRAATAANSDDTLTLGPADTADTGGLFGTPSYFAPEQAWGKPATEASDVFALGLLLHEMLTGRRAYAGADLLTTLSRLRSTDPRCLADDVPPPFDDLLRRALAPEPEDRSVTMQEFARCLSALAPAGQG